MLHGTRTSDPIEALIRHLSAHASCDREFRAAPRLLTRLTFKSGEKRENNHAPYIKTLDRVLLFDRRSFPLGARRITCSGKMRWETVNCAPQVTKMLPHRETRRRATSRLALFSHNDPVPFKFGPHLCAKQRTVPSREISRVAVRPREQSVPDIAPREKRYRSGAREQRRFKLRNRQRGTSPSRGYNPATTYPFS